MYFKKMSTCKMEINTGNAENQGMMMTTSKPSSILEDANKKLNP